MTTIAAWAEQVLHGTTLADKLLDPGPLVDTHRGAGGAVPDQPGRPAELALASPGERPDVEPLPGPAALADPGQRAALLTRFAHHELQALELMAAMLLRFPDAEPGWRRTIVSTLRDEQRHLALYLGRIQALGAPPPAPGSRFFWDLLAASHSPAHFVAGMSLTLEQANLDFLTAWGAALAAVGDQESAGILAEVYRDEVRHVRHGASWLGRWTEGSLFEAWTAHLQPPLTARRGRGVGFDVQGRQRAGLDEDFIGRVRAAGASKGRPPRVFWFHPWVEAEHGAHGYTPPARLRALAADLGPTLAAMCGTDDHLVVDRAQEPSFVAGLAARGWPVPRQVQGTAPCHEGPLLELVPWGWSETQAGRTRRLMPQRPSAWHQDTAALASKSLAARVLRGLPADARLDLEAGEVCRDLDSVRRAVDRWGEVVLKVPWSAAGRGLHRDPAAAERLLARHAEVVVEPWRERVLDLSLQATVTDRGVRDVQVVRFLTTSSGGFAGVAVGAWRRGLPTEVLRFLAGDGQDKHFLLRSLSEALSAALDLAPAHRGPVGIDAFVARIDGELRLRPLVEVNPRHTFGRVGVAVGRALLERGRAGAWLHLNRRQAGAQGFEAWAARLREDVPPQGVPLRRGVLPTTDPAQVTSVWTVLSAADTVEQAIAQVAR